MSHVLALDFGTGGVRAGVYDLAARTMRAVADSPYPTAQPRPGWAEQEPDDWWAAFQRATRAALAQAGTAEVAAVCVDATSSTVVACRRDGRPLRPAILWMDCRAARESRRTEETAHPVLAYSGGGDAVEWLVPKAMWLAAHEPAVYAQAEVLCEAVDLLNFRMTGEWAGSRLNATCKWNYDPLRPGFAPELFAALGVPELVQKLPARILPVGAPVGRMRREVAEALGIAGTPLVAQGGIDAHMGVFGADTVRPGELLMIAGSSAVHLVHAERRPEIPGIWGPFPFALEDGLWLIEGGQVSAGSVLSWLSDRIFGLDAAGLTALIAEASRPAVGATGLLALDYFMGNRTPYRDPDLRGALLGLSLGHDRAALYRAAVEAVALGSANVVQGLVDHGVELHRVVLAGGIGKNPLWLRAAVDAMGLPVDFARDGNLSLHGGAAAAAVALGAFPDLRAAARACAAPVVPLQPDPAAGARYKELLVEYRRATDAIRPIAHDLVSTLSW